MSGGTYIEFSGEMLVAFQISGEVTISVRGSEFALVPVTEKEMRRVFGEPKKRRTVSSGGM